jgi:hypothetical protein
MKKYKLIKEYPGSPILGSFTEGTSESGKSCKVIRPDGITFSNSFGWYWVENYPEFWELVIEKDYKVLSMKCNISGCFHSNNCESSIDFMLENKYSIHSVKRLSDGEIFTIGDLCSPIGKYDDNKCILNRIWFCDPGCLRLSSDNFTLGINDIQKVKQPLFTTKDGVDIFKGDSYCKVNHYSDYSIVSGFTAQGSHENYEGLKFSTKESAQEYVLMNKPCLSVRNIMSEISLTDTEKKTLKSLIEKKLNK